MTQPLRIAMRLAIADAEIIEAARKRLGLLSTAEIIRAALRALARELRLVAKDDAR